MRTWACVFAALGLSMTGCQTWGPTWSEVSGQQYPSGEIHQYRRIAIIEQVDDQGAFANYPIKVEPGERRIVVQGPVNRPGVYLKELTINVEPCKRYYVNTQFNNNVDVNFVPVIDYVEPIAGCTVVAAK